MILINLLPPELRRTHHQANPLVLGWAAAMAASLLPGVFWAWIHFNRLPEAERQLAVVTEERDLKAVEAAKVEAERAKIAEFETHRDVIVGLLARKVYWARTMDDFAGHMAGAWQGLGFGLSCSELQISPTTPVVDRAAATRPSKSDQIAFSFRGRFKIVGEVREKAGDYINAFFDLTERRPFWRQHGFVGKPEATYRGDQPEWRDPIKRVTVEFTLDWVRQKNVVMASAKAGK